MKRLDASNLRRAVFLFQPDAELAALGVVFDRSFQILERFDHCDAFIATGIQTSTMDDSRFNDSMIVLQYNDILCVELFMVEDADSSLRNVLEQDKVFLASFYALKRLLDDHFSCDPDSKTSLISRFEKSRIGVAGLLEEFA